MNEPVVVAVDGGQSGIRLRVHSEGEPLIAEGLGRLEGELHAGLIERIRGSLAVLSGGIPDIDSMVLGLTTLPASPDDQLALARRIAETFGARRVSVTGDALTAHAGALAGGAGVVLTVGTGIACLGFDPTSGVARIVDGDGFLLGDAGSAFWIGSRGVEAVLRARDGRGEPTALEQFVGERYGDHPQLAAHLHCLPRAVFSVAAFSIDVQRAAQGGDRVADRIVMDAASELIATAQAAAAVVATHPVPLALSGRAVAEGTPLRAAVVAGLTHNHDLTLVPSAGDPLDGAWMLATGALGGAYLEHMTTWSTP